MLTHKALIGWHLAKTAIEPKHPDSVGNPLPLFHIAGFVITMLSLKRGAHVVTIPKFDPLDYFRALEQYKISVIMAVPAILLALVKDPRLANVKLDNVHTIGFGAAPAGEELLKALQKKVPNLKVFSQLYGMTEIGLVACMPALELNRIPLLSCGIICDDTVTAKFVSVKEPRHELDIGEVGELWVKGNNFMKGYLNKPKETAETIDMDDWLHTGDIGYCDAAGFIYITDRLKELIKYKGYQVPPAELEDVILKHPAVQEVGVTGIPDPINPDIGELATAFVCLKPGFAKSKQLSEEIKYTVASHLAPYKQLRGGVIFLDQLPKTPTGKIQRRLLKDVIKSKAKL